MKYRRLCAPKDNDCFFHVVAHARGHDIGDRRAAKQVRVHLAETLANTLFELRGGLEEVEEAWRTGASLVAETDQRAVWCRSEIAQLGSGNGGDLDPVAFVIWMQQSSAEIEDLGSRAIRRFSYWGDTSLAATLVAQRYGCAVELFALADEGVEDPTPLIRVPGGSPPCRLLYEQNHYDAFVPAVVRPEKEQEDPKGKGIDFDEALEELDDGALPQLETPCSDGKIRLVSLTPYFAPSARGQRLELRYDIEGMAEQDVSLRIVDSQMRTVLEEQLDAEHKADGKGKVWRWNGAVEPDGWVTAAGSPYSLQLFDESRAHGGTAAFRVLVHHLELVRGPWSLVHDLRGKPPKEGLPLARWLAGHLNELGYPAGPVDEPDEHALARAITRYRVNHPTLNRWFYEDYDEPLEPKDHETLLESILGGESARPLLRRGVDDDRQPLRVHDPMNLTKQDIRVLLEAPFFAARKELERGQEEMDIQYEEGCGKTALERQRLNRPIIPLLVRVWLRGSDDQAYSCPNAVGALPIRWTHREPAEDLERQLPDDPARCSTPRRYVRTCLELDGGRSGGPLNNCPEAFGGLRSGRHSRPVFIEGHAYAPFVATAEANGVTTLTHTGELDQARGCAGVLFHPSFIAGDRYIVRAEAPNAFDPLPLPTIATDTAPIEIWRHNQLAAIVAWPSKGFPRSALARMRDEYRRAYLDFEVDHVEVVSIETVLDADDYRRWLDEDVPAVQYGKTYDECSRQLSSAATFSFDDSVGDLQRGMCTLNLFSAELLPALAQKISRRLRQRFPSGAVVIHTNPTTLHDEGNTETVADMSLGLPNGFALINHLTQAPDYYLLTHEIAHCLWLMHGQGTSTTPELIRDHDLSDRNCMMVYPTSNAMALRVDPQRATDRIEAHFCGKCNLKLRGWDISRAGPELPLNQPRLLLAWSKESVPADPRKGRPLGTRVALRATAIGIPLAVLDGTLDHALTVKIRRINGGSPERLTARAAEVFGRGGCIIEDFAPPEPSPSPGEHYMATAELDWPMVKYYEGNDRRLFPSGTTLEPLAVLPRILLCGDTFDEELGTRQEFATIEQILDGKAYCDPLLFHRDADLDVWAQVLPAAHVYHHVSHGNQQCDVHGRRAFMPSSASACPTPRYPWTCQHDRDRVEELERRLEDILYGSESKPVVHDSGDIVWAPLYEGFILPGDRSHPMRGVLQWTHSDDSSEDTVFTTDQVTKILSQPLAAPRWLAFLNCCVVGWEASMARAFIDAGTQYVWAWRCAVSGKGVGARAAAAFYTEWAREKLVPEAIPKVFRAVAPEFAATEPVLFGKRSIIRYFMKWSPKENKRIPDEITFSWSKLSNLHAPKVPDKVSGKKSWW